MYKCSQCKRVSASGEKRNTVIAQTRPKVYYRENRDGVMIEAGRGCEIAREHYLCSACFALIGENTQ